MKLYIVQLAFVAFCFIAKVKPYETDLPENYFVEAAEFLDSHFTTDINHHNAINVDTNQWDAPSVEPTAMPTIIDNGVPTEEPTAEPSAEPSAEPTLAFSSLTSLDFSHSTRSMDFSLTGNFESLPAVSVNPTVSFSVSSNGGSDGFSFDFASLSADFSLTGEFESFPTVPISQPVSLPLSSGGDDGFSFEFASLSLDFSLTMDFESLPTVSMPYPMPVPVPMPVPFPMPVHMPIPMPVPFPMPVPMPVSVPVPVPVPFPMPVPMPVSVPVPMPVPMPVSVPVPMPVPMPVSVPVPMPVPMPVSAPTLDPTALPVPAPGDPTVNPTLSPSIKPTNKPTVTPTVRPSATPSRAPTAAPSGKPTLAPTTAPTHSPSAAPTPSAPTPVPTSSAPTLVPTVTPGYPTVAPTATASPTCRPTAQPSTAAPTFDPNPPVITGITPTATRTTVALDVSFATAPLSGRVYCAAFADGTSTSLITSDRVITSGPNTVYQPGSSAVAVTITGLRSVVDYDVYCTVVTVNGVASSTSSVIATKKDVTTACCKLLTYTNAPSFVQGYLPTYTSSSPTSLYVFTYTLSSAPASSVTITPTLFNSAGSVSSALAVLPASTVFTSTATSLTGSFVLSGSEVLSGTFSVRLVPSGASVAQFGTITTTTVKVVNASSPTPVPSVVKAQFANSGATIDVTFSAATNKGGFTTASFPCFQLLTFTGSSSTTCSWVSTSVVRIKFLATVYGTNLVTVGDSITLLSGLVKALCTSSNGCPSYATAGAQSVSVLLPDSPVVPTVVLQVPSLISGCDDVKLNPLLTSGSGGRSWASVSWTASVNTGASTTSILSALNSYGPVTNNIISLSKANFPAAKYTITLTTTNFFGKSSSATAIFTIDGNPNLPIVNILGPSVLTVVPNDALSLFTTTARSSCFETASTVSYSWKVYNNGVEQTTMRSLSTSPTKFTLSPYTLAIENVYTVEFIATASATATYASITTSSTVTVQVSKGAIVAVVLGGSFRSIATVSTDASGIVSLDASQSYDQSYPRGTSTEPLSFSWSCLYVSGANYGSSCDSTNLPAVTTSSVLAVPTVSLTYLELFEFTVTVSTSDGRSSSYAVTVQNKAGTTSTTINNVVLSKVNPQKRLVLVGAVKSTTPVDASWAAFIDGVSQTFTASSPLSSTFTALQVSSFLSYPLSVPSNTFTAGSTVTFRLLAHLAGNASASSSYSEVVITMNAPPSGGTVAIDPTNGAALSQKFVITAATWTDDPADYPLSYEFTYTRVSGQPPLTVQSKTTASSVSTTLPAGLASQSNQLTVKCAVYDNFLATASATTLVTVTASASIDVSTYLDEQIAAATAAGNTEAITQAIANTASTVNEVNCTLASASFCANLNREACYLTPQTCSECIDGYTGLAGDRNTKCRDPTNDNTVLGDEGDACTTDDDCALGQCTDGVCTVPIKECYTVNTLECSGNGQCTYLTSSGAPYGRTCLITDTDCVAKCACEQGYGGKGCALSDAELVSRDSTRAQLCSAVITVSESDDVSLFLLDTLISALYSCYDPDEVVSTAAQEVCYSALTILSDYSAQGFLSEDSSDLIVAVAAKFAVSAANENSGTDRRRLDTNSTSENRAAIVDQSITGIISGVLNNMADGQDHVQIVNDDIQLVVVKSLASELTSLSPPLTDNQIDFGVTVVNSIELSETANEGFQNNDGYIEAAVLNWGANPFPNSETLENSLLRIEVRANLTDERRRRTQESVRNGSEPDFFVTLQFNEVQDFNFTLTLDQALVIKPVNYTFPECNYFNGANYSRCDGCWVSTYTNYNVTYGCTRSFIRDMPALRRRLQEETESQVVNMGAVVANIELNDFTEYVYDVRDNAVLAFMTILTVCVVVGLYGFWVWDLYDAKAKAVGAAAARANKNELEIDFSSIHGEDSLQYDAFFENSVPKPDVLMLTSSSAVANFLDSVLPDECRQDGADSWFIFLGALLQNHDYTKVFHSSPQPYTHTLRFVRITLSFLLNLFFTTIFFGAFYPNGGTCERYEAQGDCLSHENKVTDSTLCKWEVDSSLTNGGYCVLNPPPRTFVFVVTVMICVVLVSTAVLFVYDLLLKGICSLRPSLEPTPKRTAPPSSTAMTNPTITHDVYMSSKYEANQMLLGVKDYLDSSHNLNCSADQAKLEAVQKYVGIFPNGELASLDTMDRVLYATTQQRLTAHVSTARSSSKQIQESLSQFTDAEKQEQEIFLMRTFVLEQFTPLKRYLLASHLQAVVPEIPESANPILWGLTWAFVLLSIAFLLFWGFWWGARQQGDTSAAWGMVLGTALAQEVLVVQVFRCFAVSFLGLRCLYPQLQAVYRAVNKAAVSAMQDEVITDSVRVCQHLSGACRAAHSPIASTLNSARILRSIDDADVALCRLKHRTALPLVVNVMCTLPAYASLFSESLGSLLLQWLFPATLAGLLIMNFYFWKGARWVIFLPYGLLIVGYFWKYKVHIPSRHHLLVRRNSDNAYATANWNEATRGSTSRGFFGRVYSRLTAASYFLTRPSKLGAEYTPRDAHTDRQWSAMNRPANVQAVVTLIAAPSNSLIGDMHGMRGCTSEAALTAMRASVPPEIAQLLCAVHEEVELTWANAAADALRSGEMESEKAYFTNLMRADVERPLVPVSDPTSPEERYSPTKLSQRAGSSTEVVTDPEEAVARVLRIYRQHVSEGEMSLVDAEDFNALFTKEADECDVLVEFFDLRIVLEEVLCFFQPAHHPLSAEEKDEIVSSLYSWLAKNADALLDEHYQHDTNRIATATLARIQRSLPSDAEATTATQSTNFSVPFHQFRSWFLSTSMTVSTYRHAQERQGSRVHA